MMVRFAILFMCCCSSLLMAEEGVRLLNTGAPIKLQLTINQEITLVFDQRISSVGVPQTLTDKVSVASIDRRLWITATAVFKPTRLIVKDSLDRLIVLLLSATEHPTVATDYRVVSDVAEKVEVTSEQIQDAATNTAYLSFVDLTRFAAQNLYAPRRLIKRINVSRVPVSDNEVQLFSCSQRLLCGNISAKPIVSWRSNQYYVTAVELVNLTHRVLVLDPRDLMGDWLSAAFHFNRLGVKDSVSDTSVVYLVSKAAFEQSL